MREMYCITCPNGCHLRVAGQGHDIAVEGHKCDRGITFAEAEMNNPTRSLTTTVRTRFPGIPVLPVRTDGEIPKDKIMDAMYELNEVVIADELDCGAVVLENVAGTGINVILTSAALMQLGAELENRNIDLKQVGSASAAASFSSSTGNTAVVPNIGVLDTLDGPEAADGFVGAAGNAVGVESVEDDIADDEDGEPIRMKGRSHIRK